MKDELVSVIIPTYKGSNKICSVVESVLNQSYQSLEVIVVDDNGANTKEQVETENKLKKYISNNSITYLKHNINKNGAAARNTGLKKCKGKYVAFLDDDDYFYYNKIEECVDAFKKIDDSYAMVHTSYDLVFPDNKTKLISQNYSGDIFERFVLCKIRLCSSSVVIRKSVLDEVGGFDESFLRHQDWEMFTRILCKYKAYFVNVNGMKKVLEFRNSPKNPEKYEEYRLHYIDKMTPIIKARDAKLLKKFINFHYYEIAKSYLKNNNKKMYFKWLKETSNPLWYFNKTIIDGGKYLINKIIK